MKHLYRTGETTPVCGMHSTKGEPLKEYLPGALCRLCGMWQQRECERLTRKYKKGL